MNFVGINLREINLKREVVEGSFKIKNVQNNISVIDVKLKDIPVSEGKALIFTFEYTTNYELDPKGSFGSIRFLGDVVFTDNKKKVDSIMKSWKKDKKIDEDSLFAVLQAALNLVNVEAIYLSRKVMLPSPIKLPQISPKKKD